MSGSCLFWKHKSQWVHPSSKVSQMGLECRWVRCASQDYSLNEVSGFSFPYGCWGLRRGDVESVHHHLRKTSKTTSWWEHRISVLFPGSHMTLRFPYHLFLAVKQRVGWGGNQTVCLASLWWLNGQAHVEHLFVSHAVFFPLQTRSVLSTAAHVALPTEER